jgi:hypothetical protein
MDRAPSLLVLGPDAPALRREVGAVPWCALEHLVAHARAQADGWVVQASVRRLAAELGVSNGTANRALTVLRRAGLLGAVQLRDTSGRFGRGVYHLTSTSTVLAKRPAPPQPRSEPTTRRSSDDVHRVQLELAIDA